MLSDDGPRPAEFQLDTPPQPDKGYIVNVEHEHANSRFRNVPHKECQQCGAAVNRREPHTTAFIRIETSIGPQHKRPTFCGPECWFAFASARSGADD